MILGLSIQTFTVIHVIISLLAIASGILVLIGMLRSNRMPGWTTFFLLTTVLPSVTGFFPDTGILAGAGYRHSLTGSAGTRAVRPLQQASLRRLAMDLRDDCCRLALSQCVGADCKSFQKISIFKPLAPTQSEPSFLIAQAIALFTFVHLALSRPPGFILPRLPPVNRNPARSK